MKDRLNHQLQDLMRLAASKADTFIKPQIISDTLECLIYINNNMDKILDDLINKRYPSPNDADKKTFRVNDDPNKMAFHLNDFTNNPDAFTQAYLCFFEELHDYIDYLKTLDEKFMMVFLNNIRESDVGCMEARIKPALKFAKLVKKHGGKVTLFNLTSLFNLSLIKRNIITTEQHKVLLEAIKYFLEFVDVNFPVYHNNELQPISWDIIHSCLNITMSIDIPWNALNDASDLPKPNDEKIVKRGRSTFHQLEFTIEKDAEIYLAFINTILPIKEFPNLKFATINQEKNGLYRFLLTSYQYNQFVLRLTAQPESIIQDPISTSSTSNSKPRLEGPCPLPPEGIYIKSIRVDHYGFMRQCFIGLTRTWMTRPEYILRAAKKNFTAYASGAVKRTDKKPMYSWDEKAEFSQVQSMSRVTSEIQSLVFGHSTGRQNVLVGVRIHAKDTLPARLFMYDRGTNYRPYDAVLEADAVNYHRLKTDPRNPTLFDNVNKFDAALKSPLNTDKYNEPMMRARWNIDGSSHIAIFSDTLEARVVAQDFARVMLERLQEQAKENGSTLPADYEVPISFYLPNTTNPNHCCYYSYKQQAVDKKDAEKIKTILADPSYQLKPHEYYLLLALDDTCEVNKRMVGTKPLLVHLIHSGYIQLAESLLALDSEQGKNIKILETDIMSQISSGLFSGCMYTYKAAMIMGAERVALLLIEKLTAPSFSEIVNIYQLAQRYFMHKVTDKLKNIVRDAINKSPQANHKNLKYAAMYGLDDLLPKMLDDALIMMHPEKIKEAIKLALKYDHYQSAEYIINFIVNSQIGIISSVAHIIFKYAIDTHNISLIKMLDVYKHQPFYYAKQLKYSFLKLKEIIASRDVEFFEFLVVNYPELMHASTTIVQFASYENAISMIDVLLRNGVDISDQSLFIYACEHCNLQTLQHLVRLGANPNNGLALATILKCDDNGNEKFNWLLSIMKKPIESSLVNSAAIQAAKLNRLDIFSKLEPDLTDLTFVHVCYNIAFSNNYIALIKYLITHGPSQDKLHLSPDVDICCIEIFELLFKAGAHPSSMSSYPLLRCTDEAKARMLLQYGADINAITPEGTALTFAISNSTFGLPSDRTNYIKLLCENGADVNLKAGKALPLHEAIRSEPSIDRDISSILDILYTYNVNPYLKNDNGEDALIVAINTELLEHRLLVLRVYLFDFIFTHGYKFSDPHCMISYDDIFRILISSKIDPHPILRILISNGFPYSLYIDQLFSYAINGRHVTTFGSLLSLKGHKDLKVNGVPVLIAAVKSGSLAMVTACLKIPGLDIDVVDQNYDTPLFHALTLHNLSMVNLLVDRHANIYHYNDLGYTPLTWVRCLHKLSNATILSACETSIRRRYTYRAEEYFDAPGFALHKSIILDNLTHVKHLVEKRHASSLKDILINNSLITLLHNKNQLITETMLAYLLERGANINDEFIRMYFRFIDQSTLKIFKLFSMYCRDNFIKVCNKYHILKDIMQSYEVDIELRLSLINLLLEMGVYISHDEEGIVFDLIHRCRLDQYLPLLLTHSFDLNITDSNGRTPLDHIVKKLENNPEQASAIEKLITKKNVIINFPDSNKFYPLYYASSNNNLAAVKALLKHLFRRNESILIDGAILAATTSASIKHLLLLANYIHLRSQQKDYTGVARFNFITNNTSINKLSFPKTLKMIAARNVLAECLEDNPDLSNPKKFYTDDNMFSILTEFGRIFAQLQTAFATSALVTNQLHIGTHSIRA